MSAIVGIYYPHQETVRAEQLTKMVDILAHRGSDDVNIWCEGNVGLGHRMLYTTPESLHERLPLVDNGGEYVITADARIDNREELLTVLDFGNIPLEKIADSQIILAAYKKWGDECPDKLLGDFAFAIWDKPQQQLFCARDHFGVKPFYYCLSSETFIFASEIKAIFTETSVSRQINEVRIGDYLAPMFHDKEITSYVDVLRLPPASWMKVNSQGKKVQTYWTLDPTRKIKFNSNEEYVAKFKEIFTEAVRCRLRSVYALGFTLSGGLDSSSITCTAREISKGQPLPTLHTFSAVFDRLTECDERKYINPILEQGGLQSHFIYSDETDPFKELDRALWHQDEAFFAPNWFMPWTIYRKAKEEVRIILSGFDGDTTVSYGYGYLSELAKAGRWIKLAREINGLAKTLDDSFRRLYWGYFRQYGIKPVVSKVRKYSPLKLVKSWVKPLSDPDAKPSELSKLLCSQFAERIEYSERYQAYHQTLSHLGHDERELHYRNLTMGQQPFALEVMDKSTAAFGIEPRYPFWDKRLVEFCLALPSEQKLNLGYNRVIVRRAMDGIVPPEVQWRRGKTDFTPNLVRGMYCLKPNEWHKFINDNQAILQEYFDLNTLENLYQRFAASDGQETNKDARTLWLVISLVSWMRQIKENLPKLVAK